MVVTYITKEHMYVAMYIYHNSFTNMLNFVCYVHNKEINNHRAIDDIKNLRFKKGE